MEPIAPRPGDAVAIPGDYQHRARTHGFVVQRYWHWEKERIIRKFCHPQPGDLAIDVGCGSGVISDLLATLGARTIGVDSNPQAIDYARRTFRHESLSFRRCQVEDLEFPDASVDLIYCLEVIEHLYASQVTRLLSQFHRLAKPGARLLITTPNYHGIWPILELTLDSLRLVPRLRGDQHVTKFHRARLRGMLQDVGWKVERLTTFSTLAPFVSLLSWRAATAVSKLEDRLDLPFGSVNLALARKVSGVDG